MSDTQTYKFSAKYVARGEVFGTLFTIISVYATDYRAAAEMVARELQSNPSRQPYFEKWVADGRILTMDGLF